MPWVFDITFGKMGMVAFKAFNILVREKLQLTKIPD
jgi:hypothetical protein